MSAPKDEKAILEQFRFLVKDVLLTEEHQRDEFLIRWIRARDHDLEKAESMLRNSLKWRSENNIDHVLESKLDPWLFENFPFWIEGKDKLGHPVVEFPLGAWDIRRATDAGKDHLFIDWVNYFLESITSTIEKNNDKNNLNGEKEGSSWRNTQFTIIVDWKGYSYAQLIHWKALQNTLHIASTYEAHYPELLFKCFFINCPSIFPLFMALLKPILAPKTLGKITCHSSKEEWEPIVLDLIDAEELGTNYGGKCVRKNPFV